MTPDPYPDLDLDAAGLLGTAPDTDPAAMATGSDDGPPGERPELSEADSRLLDALSTPQPPVVTAVEDEPRTVRAARDDGVAPPRGPGGRSPLAPVFREPTG